LRSLTRELQRVFLTKSFLLGQFVPHSRIWRSDVHMLKVHEARKYFSGVCAVNGVTLDVKKGQVCSLIGPNGSGKTTLFNLVMNFAHRDGGETYFKGENISHLKTHEIACRGLTKTFQNLQLFGSMTALENVVCAVPSDRAKGVMDNLLVSIGGRRDSRYNEIALEVLNRVGLYGDRNMLAKNFSYGNQRRLELARALATYPDMLLLDEPFAGMSYSEVTVLISLVFELVNEGLTIFLVEHNLSAVMKISDYIYVLDHGVIIGEGTPKEVTQNEDVIRKYIGEEN